MCYQGSQIRCTSQKRSWVYPCCEFSNESTYPYTHVSNTFFSSTIYAGISIRKLVPSDTAYVMLISPQREPQVRRFFQLCGMVWEICRRVDWGWWLLRAMEHIPTKISLRYQNKRERLLTKSDTHTVQKVVMSISCQTSQICSHQDYSQLLVQFFWLCTATQKLFGLVNDVTTF